MSSAGAWVERFPERGRVVDWLAGWLAGGQAGRLAGWLGGWLRQKGPRGTNTPFGRTHRRCPRSARVSLPPAHDTCFRRTACRARCEYSTQEPKRRAFKFPQPLRDQVPAEATLVAAFKFKKQQRLFATRPAAAAAPAAAAVSAGQGAGGVAVVGASASTADKFTGDKTDSPLAGFTVALAGKLSGTQKAITQRVQRLGGAVVRDPDEGVTCLIASEGELLKHSSRVKAVCARGCGAPV